MNYPRYDPYSPLTPLTPGEIDALDRLLQALPVDGAMTLDGADGYLTALAIGPRALLVDMDTAEWLPLVWGGDEGADGADGADGTDGASPSAPFASRRQRKDSVVLLLRHLRFIAAQFADTAGREAWEPIFSIAERGADEFADARDWCAGFLQAVDLQPGAWGGVWTDPVFAPLLHLGGGLEDWPIDAEVAAVDTEDPEGCDALSRAVPEAVLHLHAAFHAAPQAAIHAAPRGDT